MKNAEGAAVEAVPMARRPAPLREEAAARDAQQGGREPEPRKLFPRKHSGFGGTAFGPLPVLKSGSSQLSSFISAKLRTVG